MFDESLVRRLKANASAPGGGVAPQAKKKGFLLDQISTVGGIAGGIAGLPLGIIGAGVGAGAGSALGEAIENQISGEDLTKNVAREGIIGGVLGAGPLRLGKLALGVGGRAVAGKVAPGLAGRIGEGVTDRATTNLLKLTPAQTRKLLDSGVDPSNLARRATQFGKTAEDIIGRTGNKGPLQSTIKGLEQGITQTTKTTGSNIRIPGDEIIKTLKSEAKGIRQELGGGARYKAINQIIADAEKKYSKGITVGQARNTLREANQRFGASILDDTGDAVARAAQKLEANTLRTALKSRFPEIGKALDDQSELIQLREILKGARAKDITGGFKLGKLDVTRPGTFVDPILNSQAVSRSALGSETGLVGKALRTPPSTTRTGIAGREIAGGLLRGQQEPTLEDALSQSMNSANSPYNMTATNNPMSNTMGESYQNGQDLSSASPYTKEGLFLDIQRDPENAQDYIDYYSQLQEIFGVPEEKALSGEASKVVSNATIGLQALDDFESAVSEDPGVLAKRIIPGRGLLGGALGGALGTRGADAAAAQIVDVIARLRTGAAITNEEAARFETFIPQAGDPQDVARQKLNYLRGQFQMVAGRTGGSSSDDLVNSLMQAQGAY